MKSEKLKTELPLKNDPRICQEVSYFGVLNKLADFPSAPHLGLVNSRSISIHMSLEAEKYERDQYAPFRQRF